MVGVLGGVMALAAAISAVQFAPHRGLVTRILCAWLLGALPIPLALTVIAMTPQPYEVRDFYRHVYAEMGFAMYIAYLAIPVLLSVIFALMLGRVQRILVQHVMRRHFRTNSERLRGLARPTHFSSDSTIGYSR